MTIETVAVTGGTGKVGSRIVAELNDEGYRVANLDVQRPEEVAADSFIETDLFDAGEVYGSIARSDADAVVHMGTYPHPLHHPGYVTFESNVMTSYHVMEAAAELELEAACLASSINAIGRAFQDVPPEVHYLPIDEEHPATPRDPYGLGKRVTEEIAAGFGRLPDPPETISTLRYPYAATTDELREFYAETDRSLSAIEEEYDAGDNPLLEYVHVDDIARAARLAIEADYEGHETFWILADDTTADAPTAEVVETFYPEMEVRTSFSDHEGLITPRKAADVLGWTTEHSWREL